MLVTVTRIRWIKPNSLLFPSSSRLLPSFAAHVHNHNRPLPLTPKLKAKMSTTPTNNNNNNNSSSNSNNSNSNDMSRPSSNPNSDPSTPDDDSPIFFGPFEVTSQVFLRTPLSFALVNLKPLLPGHVLVCPRAAHRRLTDLSAPELTDLWSAVQRVQRVLARYYFGSADDLESGGSFNLALQDGPESGQTVPHVHVHVIPRIRGSTAKSVETPSDELYERMAGEDGNVGGALWDRDMGRDRGRDGNQGGMLAAAIPRRPEGGGSFPSIEDAQRQARSMEEMEEEAALYRRCLDELEGKKTRKGEGVKGEA